MSPYTIDAGQPGLAEILSSLPLTLADGTPPQIVAVAGEEDWPDRAAAAVAGGALAVVVDDPVAAELGALRPEVRARVVLCWPFASNPGVSAAATEAEPIRARAMLVQATLTVTPGTELRSRLLDLLVTSVRVIGEVGDLTVLRDDDDCLYGRGRLATGAPVTVTVLRTGAEAPGLRLKVLTGDGALDVTLPPPLSAAPAEVRVTDARGECQLPSVWVTSRRTAWQDAAAVAAGECVSADVDELARLAASATPLVGGRA